MKCPLPILSDYYTLCSNNLVSEQSKKLSVYNLTNRISPKDAWSVCKDSRMVLYGIQYFCHNYLTRKVTQWDIDETDLFLSDAHAFGGALDWDKDMWQSLVGKPLPIKIEGLREGSCFFPNEPYIQVTAKDGYGELAAHIEAVLVGVVSNATALATLNRHWLDHLQKWCRMGKDISDQDILEQHTRFMLHDFGMRACCGAEHAEILGLANLLSFHGTDTTNAAYSAWRMGAKRPTGTSIPALAHRIVQGHKTEDECFNQTAKNNEVASYVADCYNFRSALYDKLLKLAAENKDRTIVVRPDSGDYVETVRQIVYASISAGLPNLRYIQGDSMNPNKIDRILESLNYVSDDPTSHGIFGVGGWRINNTNRDSLSTAYKLSANADGPVCKLSEIPEKMSIPGPNVICNTPTIRVFFEKDRPSGYDTLYQTYYDNGEFPHREPFCDVQDRNILDFQNAVHHPGYGLNGENLSTEIKDFRQKVYNEHRG